MIRCLVFDFDGTLVPSNAIKRAAYAETVAAVPGAAERVHRIVAANPDYDRYSVFAELAREVPDAGDPETLTRRYGATCEAGIVPLLDNGPTRTLIAALNALGLPCHIATATPRDAMIKILDRAQITDVFASIHGRPETKTAALKTIMAEGPYRPSEVAMIGDGDNDRVAAARAGVTFVAVDGNAPQLYADVKDAIAFLRRTLPFSQSAPAA